MRNWIVAGFAFLAKPFKHSELLACVRRELGNRPQRDQDWPRSTFRSIPSC